MNSSSSIQFIETALCCTTPCALSYTDPDKKWIIRKHLLSLLQYQPTFRPSSDTFTHNDGTTVNLLNVTGRVKVSRSTPLIPFRIWVHENYPDMAPMVFVLPDPDNPIHRNHPFVDSSGAVITPYIITWKYPKCNLSGLVRNTIKLFSHDHPFSFASASGFTDPSLASKMEAIDRLTGMIHYDILALQSKNQVEIEELSILQEELLRRAGITENLVTGLEEERRRLKQSVEELAEGTDRIANWVRFNDPKSITSVAASNTGNGETEEAFEAVDSESEVHLGSLAADLAIEDLMSALDRALESRVLGSETYVKEVRNLARVQFFHRDQRWRWSLTPR
ncbi:hypothetical protein SLA2020_164070 [Shorea laevis]